MYIQIVIYDCDIFCLGQKLFSCVCGLHEIRQKKELDGQSIFFQSSSFC